VELGEAVLGFVYLSDAKSSDKVKIVAVFPELSHKAIDYQAVIIDPSNAAAIRFFDFLSSEEVKAVWQNRGFSL
jgi:molybdate transport system substrate-binding protein